MQTNNKQYWLEMLIALLLAVIVGLLFAEQTVYIKPIGEIFLNAIRLIIVPIVFITVVNAIISLDENVSMGRVLAKSCGLYTLTTSVAALVGLSLATAFSLGSGVDISNVQGTTPIHHQTITINDFFVSIIPSNPIAAFMEGNILQIVVFSIILGLSINLAGEAAQPVKVIFRSLLYVVFKLAEIIIRFTPIGVFALISTMIASFGWQILLPVFQLFIVLWLACLTMWLFYGGMLLLLTRLNPLKFYRGAREPFLFALLTTSSAATLPISIKNAEQKLGMSYKMSNFLLPLGTSINLDGLALYLTIAAVFTANIYGIELGLTQYLVLILTTVIASMGAGGVPGVSFVIIGVVLSSVGLPLETIALFAAVARIAEMSNTATNVLGDLFTATTVAHSENELDKNTYNAKE